MFVFSPLSLRYPPLDLSPRLDLFTVFENLSKSLILQHFAFKFFNESYFWHEKWWDFFGDF